MITQPSQDEAARWRKGSACAGVSDCVEIACSDSLVLVRDSDHRSGPMLRFTAGQWRGFLRDVKSGGTARG